MKIYLDNNSTTPLDPRVLEAMLEEMNYGPLNPSSIHSNGQKAKRMLHNARLQVSDFFSCDDSQIFFTSSATEAINWLIRDFSKYVKQIITTEITHSCVYNSCYRLQGTHLVNYLPVDHRGCVELEELEKFLKREPLSLIVLNACNNETGVKNPVEKIAELSMRYGALLIIDGVAALGKMPINFYPGITGMVFSAHKIHGPKGSGLALVRDPHLLSPLNVGGHQEMNLRAGTENLAGIIGMSTAISLIDEKQYAYLQDLRDAFEKIILESLDNCIINGTGERVGNVSNLAFLNVDAESLLINLDQRGILASFGAACSSGGLEPSRILLKMGHSYPHARSSIRFSFGRMNTFEEVKRAAMVVVEEVRKQLACVLT